MRLRIGTCLVRRAATFGLAAVFACGLLGNDSCVLGDEPAADKDPLKSGAPPARAITAKGAIVPAAPILPAGVVAAMQEGRFAEADAELARLSAALKSPADRSYYAFVRGIAQRLAGKTNEARATLRAALEADPKGPWSAKTRLELAGVELAAGRADEAEALARAQAETLLAGERKDRLAEVYYAFARRLLKPDDPVTPPDPNTAYALLEQARSLAKGEPFRATLLYAMALASQKAKNPGRAIQDLQNYLKEYPKGADRAEARYHLGEAQRDAGQNLPARLTWTDLARDLDGKTTTKTEAEVRARALYGIALTYGIPAPPDDTSLNLGVAALRRFLAAYPAHPLAVRAAYQIGEAYRKLGKSDDALAAFTAFLKGDAFKAETDEARREASELAMTATFLSGAVLQGQQKFDEAIAAWKGYLAKYPNGPQSADAQRAILDTQLMIAADFLQRERYDDARSAWLAFVAQNPLDGRVPQVLFQVGESYVAEKKYDQAIAAWDPVLSKFPGSEPASHAQFEIASIYETEKGDPESAIERFRKVASEPWRSQANQRIAVMESKALTVVTPRTFRSGETPQLKLTTRNLEKLTFSAYKLNPEAYFRKKHALSDVESLDIGLVAPDAEWTVSVPGYARYKPVEKAYDLEKVALPGVYVVKVSDEKNLQATTLVVGSNIDAVVKTSRDQLLVFAQDMKTGKGRPNARVLVAQGEEVVLEAKTGPDGVLLQGWEKPRDVNAALQYLVLDGGDVAGSGLNVPGKVAQGLSARAYLYTDRPAYRPGQEVALRGVVREVKDGQYANTPKAVYKLEVTDSRGRQIVARPVTLSDFGTFHETLPLDSGAPVGTYRVRLYQPGKSDFAGQFEVQSYRLEAIDLAFDLKSTVVFRGETVEGDLVARYQYGAPAASRPIAVRLPDGRVVRGTTDASGKFHVSFPTEGFAEEQVLTLQAQLTQDNVAAAANVALAVRAFSIAVTTKRDVYLDGEPFQVDVTTRDARGEPTGQTLSVALVKRVDQAGRTTEREVARQSLTTDAKTGVGRVSLKADDRQGGSFVVRVAGTDRFGNPVVTDRELTISGEKDETRLRLLADRQSYKVGEEASMNLHSRGTGGTALLTWEADRILSYRIVTLLEGNNSVAWAIDGSQFPNFTLAASRMAGDKFDQATIDVRVERDLRVTVTPTKPVVGPGEDVTVDVTTADQLGRPVSAELAMALVDRSLLRLYNDRLPPIGAFFYDQTRTGAFSTESTNTFSYHPTTTAVAEAVVEDAERAAALASNTVERGRVLDEAKRQVQLGLNAPMPAPDRPPAGAPEAAVSKDAAFVVEQAQSKAGAADQRGAEMLGEHAGRDLKKSGKPQATWGYGVNGAAEGLKEKEGVDFFAIADPDASREFADKLGKASETDGIMYKRKLGGLAEGRRAGRAPAPRERFVETAYWNPSVVTGADGKAHVTFKAPTALSSYQFTARGVTGADTLVGQTTAGLTVRKDFFVDLKVPAELTQGDKPRFAARVHHLGVKGQVALKLAVYAGGRDQVDPKTIELKGDGVDEVLFEPFEVPDGENVRLTLTAEAAGAKDELVVEVPVRPWGVQATASASGTAANDSTVFVGLPAGRTYENPEMLVVVSPTLRRLLIELAIGRDYYVLRNRVDQCILPPPGDTTADRASDLLAATSALSYLRTTAGASAAPEATRLTERVRGLVTELTASQQEDGGWAWVQPYDVSRQPPNQRPTRGSDRMTTTRVVWALASAEPLGLLTDPKALDKASAFLTQEYARLGAGDHETRAAILHALSTRGKASFEAANSVNRLRQGLSDAALAYLALTFANLDRKSLAGEVLDVLGPRGKVETAVPGGKTRRWWGGSGVSPWNRSAAETTGLVALAYAQARPQAPELDGAAEWLLAHRVGFGWQPHKAKGPALAALSAYYGRAQGAEDRYNLVVTVNDTEVYRAQVIGTTEGKAVLVPRDALKVGDRNRVRFHVEGRGTFGYSVTLTGFTREFGPDQARANRSAIIDRRVYLPADPELDGKTLPTGFGVAVNATAFENKASQLAVGGRGRVQIDAHRIRSAGQPEWEQDFLIVEEHLPAGTTLIEGSVQTSATSYTLVDNLLTFYFAPDQWPGAMRYDVYGYLPGTYRTLPPSIRSAYDPGRSHLGPAGDLRVLSPGENSTDPYKATPDELYARGKAHFDAGRLAEATPPLEELFNAYTLRDDVAKDAARMLLLAHIKHYNARKVVQYFEVVKEKAPELVVTFDDLLVIGRAYRDINEYERAYLVWRGVAEASYLEDARVGEVLRQRGKTLEGIAYLIDLWREYPDSASIESDFFGLSQVLARHAGEALTNPTLRRELADAGVTRSELLLQSIRLIQVFLTQAPKNPVADEASLALVGDFLELEDYPAVVKLSARFAKLYPKSTFLDSFQYSEALGEFHLGHYDRAVVVAKAIAAAVYKDAAGADQPSPNKWQALYILGQIYDARRQPAQAIEYYKQVAERFTDAAEAVRSFTRKGLKLPEVTVVRPPSGPRVALVAPEPGGFRNVGIGRAADEPEPRFPETLKLSYRNIAEADVKVYPVDLMRLYLTRRNLDAIAGIDLAGITPLVEKTITLGKGEDFADKLRTLDLGLTKEGAYLVMVRGENLYASGIVLVTPLELEVLEEAGAGRVRVSVRDAATGSYVPKVQVKVIGSGNRTFITGETDLRGVFVAEGVEGEAAAVARKGTAQYAFYRGQTVLSVPKPPAKTDARQTPPAPGQAVDALNNAAPSLEENIKNINSSNQIRQLQRLEQRYNENPGQGGAAAGGFR